jgi:outer membrane protein assembly factor BamB
MRVLFVASLAALMIAGPACRNRPPDVPAVPMGPAYCFKDTTYTFKTIVNDPEGDRVAARFDWGDSSVSGWTGTFPSGDTIALAHAWHDTGTYDVSVQATGEGQQRSGWSGNFAVRVVLRRPPNMPLELTGPDRGGQDTSYAFATSASHPDTITVAIRFAWGDGDTSDWSSFVPSGETVTTSHTWTAPDTYTVTAQARDTGSGRSLWSLPHSIIIKPRDTLRIWRLQLADSNPYMISSPAIGSDGTIYVGSSDNSLYAVNADGSIKWSYPTGFEIQSSPAVASDGTIYVGSSDHYLYAFNPDGTLKWRYSTVSYVRSSPAIAADGTVYVGSDDYVYALSPDGTLKWRYMTGGVTSSPCIAADGTVYVGSYSDSLYALNPDGTLKWGYDVGDNINRASAALGADGTVYCGADRNDFSQSLYALNPDGTLRWSYATGGDIRSSPAIAGDGTVYVGSGHYLFALNPDGTLKWSYQTGGNIRYSSPAIASDGTVYFGSTDNFLYALYSDGTLKWHYETGENVEAAPTLGQDGTVYFLSNDGYLYALKGTSPLADSPWPKFHHDLRNTGCVGGGR